MPFDHAAAQAAAAATERLAHSLRWSVIWRAEAAASATVEWRGPARSEFERGQRALADRAAALEQGARSLVAAIIAAAERAQAAETERLRQLAAAAPG